METKTYNGWTNYETWCVKLWIDNEEGSYRAWQNAARECWAAADAGTSYPSESKSDAARTALAAQLKDSIDESMPEDISNATSGTMYADLLNAALSEVNWYEMADAMLEDNCDDFKSFR